MASTTFLQQAYLAYFGRPADVSGLSFYNDKTEAQVVAAFSASPESQAFFGSLNTLAQINTIYQNLFNRPAEPAGLTYWSGEINAGRLSLAQASMGILNGAQNADKIAVSNKLAASTAFTAALDTTDEMIGYQGTAVITSARAFLASVSSDAATLTAATSTTALNATVAATVAAGSTASVAGQTFTLTTSADSFTGTAGNDTFNATNAAVTAAGQTFTVADTLVGGAGADTLNVVVGAASTYALSNVSGVEAINATFAAAGTVSLLGSSGVTSAAANGSTAASIINNIGSTTAVTLGLRNTDQAATFTFTAAAVAGGTDVATLRVSGVAQATTVATTIADVETLSIIAEADSTIGLLTAGSATTVNVSGAGLLTVVDNLAVATTVNASTNTGGVDLDFGVGAVTVTGGTGNDTFSFEAAGNVNVNGGAGNDTFIFDATGTLTTDDSIVGGDGVDTLRVATSANLTGYTAPATATITGIERLQFDAALGANLTTANVIAGIERVTLALGAGGNTITMAAGDRTVAFSGAAGAATTVADTGSAITDTLTLLNTSAATDVYDGRALTVTGFETVTVNSSTTTTRVSNDLDAIGITPDSGGAVSLIFVGNNTVTTGAITATGATSGTVNASGLTGTATFTNVGASTGITSMIGSSNADTLVGSATATTIAGGAGNDTITGGAAADNLSGEAGDDQIDGAAGNDVLSGGDGIDSITAGAGLDTVTGGAGNDTIVFGAEYATGDSIDGGDGIDTLSVTQAVLGTLNGYSISTVTTLNNRVSGIENLLVSDQFNVGAAFDMTRADSISQITLVDGINGNEEISGLASGSTVVVNADNAADTDILTLSLADNTGASDVVNYTMTQAGTDDYAVLAIAGAETVNLTINEATANATVRVGTIGLTLTSDGTTTRAITLNVSGTEALTVDTAIGATTISTTGLSGAFIMTDTTGSALAQTFTTGSGNDTIYGGGGIDTIDTGSGTDSIVGGTGADVITGGAGADTIVGGAGNDSITLTESSPAVDRVTLNYSGVGTEVDSITGFTTTSTGDNIAISYGAMNLAGTTGIHSATTALVNGAGTAIAAAAASTYLRLTGATTVGTETVFGLGGATLASTDAVEDALEAGGAFAITGSNAAFDTAANTFIVAYTDGTDAYIAIARANSQTTNNESFETGDLVVKNIAKLVGVTSIGSTTFAAANFDLIA